MCELSISRFDDFEESMGIRRTALEFNGECRKEQDLYGRSTCIPDIAIRLLMISSAGMLTKKVRYYEQISFQYSANM